MRRSWFHLVLVLAMLPLLACNCAMLEGLFQGITSPTVEPTMEAPPPSGPPPTLVVQSRPTFPAITLDELDVPLVITNPSAETRQGEPVTSGLPIPRQLALIDLANLRILDPDGNPVPAQFTPLARWGGAPDAGSAAIRWLLLDFQVDVAAGGSATYRLQGAGGPLPSFPTLNITDGADAVTIDTGAAVFSLSKTDGGLTGPGLSAPIYGGVREPGGGEYTSTGSVQVSIELSGPLRASVKVKGTLGAGLNLRAEPATSARLVGNAKEGSELLVLEGPEEGADFVWWKLRAPDGTEGWGAADWLVLKGE